MYFQHCSNFIADVIIIITTLMHIIIFWKIFSETHTVISTNPNPEAKDDVDQMYHQRNEELDDTMAFVHDNSSLDNPKTRNYGEKNEEQAYPNVENAPTKEEGHPIVGGTQAQPTIHDSSSNTSLSKEKNLAINKKTLTEALKRLQKLRKLPTDTRSSHSSKGDASEGVTNLLTHQLNDNIFKVDLLTAIEGGAQLGTDIHNFFTELKK